MGKVTRKNLPRGVVLTVDHVFDPIEGMASGLSQVGIDADQMEAPYSTFRVNLNTPWLDSKYFFDNATTDGDTISETATSCNAPYYIPFALPPLQDEWPDDGVAVVAPGQSVPVLDEISFSFDQSDEPAVIMSQWFGKKTASAVLPAGLPATGATQRGGYLLAAVGEGSAKDWVPNPYEGKKSYDRTNAYDFRIVIYEKEQFAWNDLGVGSMTPVEVAENLREVASVSYPATNFIGTIARFNPAAVTGINRQFSPFKTYVAALFAPNLHDFDPNRRQHAAVVSAWIGLKFKSVRVERDIGAAEPALTPDVQNIPVADFGARHGETVAITAPVAGDLVSADVLPSGISANLQKVDEVFHDKIRGGYSTQSMTYPEEQIEQDAGYEVITVPIGGGFPFNRMGARDDYPVAPYTYQSGSNFRYTFASANTASDYVANGDGPYVDRRLIPIVEPFVLHHVILALNHTSDRVPVAWNHTGAALTDTPNWLNATQPAGEASPGVSSIAQGFAGTGYVDGVFGVLPGAGVTGTELRINITTALGLVTGGTIAYPGRGYTNGDIVFVDSGDGMCFFVVTVNTRTVGYEVGVAMVSGPGGDDFEYQQVAHKLYTNGVIAPSSPTVPDASIIDAVRMGLPAVEVGTQKAEYKLINIPLVGTRGNSYTDGGTPVFIGQSNSNRSRRSLIPDGGGVVGTPFDGTPGVERYLEVRLKVDPTYDVYGLDGAGYPATDPDRIAFTENYRQSDIFVGYGGCWVYLIGKKHLT